MRLVGHTVCLQRAEKRITNFLCRGNIVERQCLRRVLQALQMSLQRRDAAFVNAQALPDSVTALHDTVEYGDFRIGPLHQLAIDVHHDSFVAWICT